MRCPVDEICDSCDQEAEPQEHRFFKRSFPRQIWGESSLSPVNSHRQAEGWNLDFSRALSVLKGTSLKVKLMKLAWNWPTYYIWREKNRLLLHEQVAPQASSKVVAEISLSVKTAFEAMIVTFLMMRQHLL